MQQATRDSLNLIVGLYLVVFLAVAIHLLERWYTMQAAHAKAERARLETELQLKEAELKLLRDQIHPHFLFNTLNNLYSLTLTGSKHAPDVVLNISEMLDYMLYRCDAPRVPLAGEVDNLHHYLSLEKLRYGPRVDVTFQMPGPTDGDLATHTIAPLLLLPFVENSFKHGVSQERDMCRVEIRLALVGRDLTFSVTNTKPPEATPVDDASGIGLANVRKRLDLLYPETNRLDIDDAPHRFTATLHLKLDAPT
jgi:LytS/YehU family sensor histidine kinase